MNISRRQKDNSKLYAHGSIVRMKLENFVYTSFTILLNAF